MSEKIHVSWKKVIDTGVTSNSTPGVVAVGDGGILYPFEHQASHEGIKFKSVCAYRDGMLIIGDWKMFIVSATSQNVETTMSADVVDCTSIMDSGGVQHTYIVTSEGHVLYSSSEYPEYEFKITKNVSDGFTGCKSCNINGRLTVLLYGKSVLMGTPGDSLKSFKRIVPSVSIDSIDILPNGNIIILDTNAQSLDVLSSDSEIINKIGFIDFINTRIGFECKFTFICVYDYTLYLLGTYGIVAMIKLGSSGDIKCSNEPVSQINNYYGIQDFYFTKISDVNWNDMIKIDNYFIGVGDGDINKSSFIIDNLPEVIISHDYRHKRVDYTNEIMRLANKDNIKYVIRREINMCVDDGGHPYFNLNDFLQVDDNSLINELLSNIRIIIMPTRGSINGRQNWEYDIRHEENSSYFVYFPQLKCNYLSASITIKL